MAEQSAERVEEIPLEQISPDPQQPRRHMDEASLSELMASIESDGLLQPIMVRPDREGYTIVIGHRRHEACKRLNLATIRATIREVDQKEAFRLALEENLQREDLSPFDLAEGYRRLMDDYGLTQAQIADRLNKSAGTISEALAIGELPDEIRQEYEAMPIDQRPAKSFLLMVKRAKNKRARLSMWKKIKSREIETIQQARGELAVSGLAKGGEGGSTRTAHHLVVGAALRAANIPPEYFRTHPQQHRALFQAAQQLSVLVEQVRAEIGEPPPEAQEEPEPSSEATPRKRGRKPQAAS